MRPKNRVRRAWDDKSFKVQPVNLHMLFVLYYLDYKGRGNVSVLRSLSAGEWDPKKLAVEVCWSSQSERKADTRGG